MSCLPGEITAWAEPRVPRVPAQVVQFRAELRGSVSCWSPLGCSSRGASGCGSGMGKRCRQGSPLWVTAADPPQSLQCTSDCTDVPWCSAPPHTGRASPGTQLGGGRRKFSSTFLTPPHWSLFPYTRLLLPFACSGKACCKNRQCKNRQLFTFCSQRNLKPQH